LHIVRARAIYKARRSGFTVNQQVVAIIYTGGKVVFL